MQNSETIFKKIELNGKVFLDPVSLFKVLINNLKRVVLKNRSFNCDVLSFNNGKKNKLTVLIALDNEIFI